MECSRKFQIAPHRPEYYGSLLWNNLQSLPSHWLVWRKYFDWRIWASLVPIVGGILLTSVTELSFNMFGFCAALFGCLATSTKTILAESLLHGYKFDSINTVYYMAPLATMILDYQQSWLKVAGFATGSNYGIDMHTLCPNLNCVQVAFAVLISWMIFRNPISVMNAVGCAITLVGCTFYGYVRHLLSQQQPPPGTPRTPRTPRSRMELLPLVNDKLDDKV
ncbi:UDP-galactose transporter 1 [Populus alba x Populus x berolinensis]|uniref:UDP-galactose transporter 1 n=1 Tax=Populus alba x Populus x berolinensis TaxID=444605 RepID=A0AAD6W3H3_9ROSI|nr:UDP-galactose transporter 1 [Populus alba x Populus x berolinensis]